METEISAAHLVKSWIGYSHVNKGNCSTYPNQTGTVFNYSLDPTNNTASYYTTVKEDNYLHQIKNQPPCECLKTQFNCIDQKASDLDDNEPLDTATGTLLQNWATSFPEDTYQSTSFIACNQGQLVYNLYQKLKNTIPDAPVKKTITAPHFHAKKYNTIWWKTYLLATYIICLGCFFMQLCKPTIRFKFIPTILITGITLFITHQYRAHQKQQLTKNVSVYTPLSQNPTQYNMITQKIAAFRTAFHNNFDRKELPIEPRLSLFETRRQIAFSDTHSDFLKTITTHPDTLGKYDAQLVGLKSYEKPYLNITETEKEVPLMFDWQYNEDFWLDIMNSEDPMDPATIDILKPQLTPDYLAYNSLQSLLKKINNLSSGGNQIKIKTYA